MNSSIEKIALLLSSIGKSKLSKVSWFYEQNRPTCDQRLAEFNFAIHNHTNTLLTIFYTNNSKCCRKDCLCYEMLNLERCRSAQVIEISKNAAKWVIGFDTAENQSCRVMLCILRYILVDSYRTYVEVQHTDIIYEGPYIAAWLHADRFEESSISSAFWCWRTFPLLAVKKNPDIVIVRCKGTRNKL